MRNGKESESEKWQRERWVAPRENRAKASLHVRDKLRGEENYLLF